jgi:hypothetical protein
MARCEHCGALFALRGAPWGAAEMDASRAIPRQKVPMPKGIEVVDFGTTLEITRRWFHPMYLFLLVFCVFWNGFMVVWHGMSLLMGAWFMSCFGLFHTAVGVGLAYFTLAGLVNRTVIRADRSMIDVRHGPLPWPGSKSLPAEQIDQLYCKESVSHGNNGPQHRYSVEVALKGNTLSTLLKGLEDAGHALYIEQELERHLGIEDRPVRGELPR